MKPSRTELNRLYWMEEMSVRAIAAHIQAHPSTVRSWLHAYQIPRRAPHRPLSTGGICKTPGCSAPTCRVKDFSHYHPWRWVNASRCRVHWHAERRRYQRAAYQRKTGSTRPNGPTRLPLGRMKQIAEDRI